MQRNTLGTAHLCGISAIWNWSGRTVTFGRLRAMAIAQMHRGPDGHGYAVWANGGAPTEPAVWRGRNAVSSDLEPSSLRLGLAHNWLAIQDTSAAARQPMCSKDGRYWLIYNGEIYNFVELRQEMRAAGSFFDTSSDTEVLLSLWQKLGPAALARVRGMFAFVIYDTEEDTMWAARDRFGIKPLYYAPLAGDGGIVIASEFRGVHASGLVPRRWNERAVQAFLCAGVNKVGETATFFDGVSELPPGSVLEISRGKIAMEPYYRLPAAGRSDGGGENLDELRRLFVEVTRLHLRSAREVGTCMSGGLDSTNIASAIHKVLGDDVNRFKAFTLGTAGRIDFDLARLASKTIGFRHFTMAAPKTVGLPDLVDMIIACETPNHTWGPINQYLLLRYIRNVHDVHVLLNGQGGDEVFSGYAWFYPVLERRIRQLSGPEQAKILRASHFGRPPYPLFMLESFHQTFFSRRKWIESFDGGALAVLGLSTDEVLEWEPVNYYLNDELDWPEFREREFYRRELQYLLRHEDRLAMWFSIESRVPFLDHTFVEQVSRLHPGILIRDGYLKYPLRVLFDDLPEEVRFNVVKNGFWEDYSSLSCFGDVARRAVRRCAALSGLVRDDRLIENLSMAALWRFFQMAVLFDASSAEEGRTWARDFHRGLPAGRFTFHPWFQKLRRRSESFARLFN